MPANNGKKTVIFMTDAADTGFGRVGKEIVTRFAQTGLYNIVFCGWASHQSVEKWNYWQKLGVVFETTHQVIEDQFGQKTLPHLIQKYDPDLIWTLGDPWMVEHVARCPGAFERWKWISYIPIDREPLNKEWLPSFKAPDVVVLYSKFGEKVLKNQLPRIKTEVIYHGVDTDTFRPVDKSEAKKHFGIDPTTFIVGFVGRNQVRKRIPRLIKAFKFWNCLAYNEDRDVNITAENGDREVWNARAYAKSIHYRVDKWNRHFKQDPAKFNSALYMHTTQGYTDNNDGLWVGWHMNEYADRYELNDNPFGKPSRLMLPDQNAVKSIKGLPDDELNLVYNMIDVHVLPSCREGFGLPIIEAMSCGVPSIVTNYSSMPELVEDGRGLTCNIADFDDEPFFDAPSALIDVGHLVTRLNEAVAMHNNGAWRQMQVECRNFALKNTWNAQFMKFMDLFRELIPV